jgi:hypothetical protein
MPTTLLGTFPVLLPGTASSVSRNGLKKTTGSILFKLGQELEAESLASSQGSVFPVDPQVRTTDLGLMEMSFDAYTDTGAVTGVFGTEVINLSKSFQEVVTQTVGTETTSVTYNWTITEVWILDSYTNFKVITAATSSVFLPFAPNLLLKRMLKRIETGRRPVGGATHLTISWQNFVSGVTRRNFGTFDEVDIITALQPTIS